MLPASAARKVSDRVIEPKLQKILKKELKYIEKKIMKACEKGDCGIIYRYSRFSSEICELFSRIPTNALFENQIFRKLDEILTKDNYVVIRGTEGGFAYSTYNVLHITW